jgi:hypothetical protein
MNKLTKVLIGAALGGGIGWFVGQIAQDYLAEKQARENLELAEEIINRRALEFDQEEPKPVGKKKKSKKESHNVAPIRDYGEYYKALEHPELAALVEKYNGDDPILEEQEEEKTVLEVVEFSVEADQANKDPRIISVEDFDESVTDGYIREYADYYDDDVLTIHNEPVRNPEQIVGEDALISFGELSEDPNKVYVLNETLKVMYEITKMNKVFIPIKPRPHRRPAPARLKYEKAKELEEENGEEN